MDNSKIRTELTCYIGETAYKAGIFLSYRIAERKSYFKNLKLERFTSFNEAEDEFKKRYGEVVDMTIFKLNHLYSVRSQNVYSVFWTPLNVGICYTCAFSDAADMLIPEDDNMRWWKHGLTYDEEAFYVDYQPIGSNLYPEATVVFLK